MCYTWEGQIEKCQNSSEFDFHNFLNVVWNIAPARPTHQLIARNAHHASTQGHPPSSRHNVRNDVRGPSMAENSLNHVQDLTHQAQPSSWRPEASVNGTAQKRPREDADQPSSSTHDDPNKRQRTSAGHPSTSKHDSQIDEQRQYGRQGQIPDDSSSLRRDTRNGTTQLGQQTQIYNELASSRRDARSDRTKRHGQRESHQGQPHSSRHSRVTDPTGEEEHQAPSQAGSQNDSRIEDMEVETMRMNRLPPPCWEDDRIFFPQVREQLALEEYFERQEQTLEYIWGLHVKERDVLLAPPPQEPEEKWTPIFEEETAEERVPSWEEMWESTILDGEDWMRSILDEDDTWPEEQPEERNIWTREEGGMLSASVLRKLLRIFTLQAALEEQQFQESMEEKRRRRSDDFNRRRRKRDEVTQRFSDALTSADDPPLAADSDLQD